MLAPGFCCLVLGVRFLPPGLWGVASSARFLSRGFWRFDFGARGFCRQDFDVSSGRQIPGARFLLFRLWPQVSGARFMASRRLLTPGFSSFVPGARCWPGSWRQVCGVSSQAPELMGPWFWCQVSGVLFLAYQFSVPHVSGARFVGLRLCWQI